MENNAEKNIIEENITKDNTIKENTIKENTIDENIIKENTMEKSLVKKGETSLRTRNTYMIKPILKTTAGILFYAASFIISMTIGYAFVFSMFN